MINQIFIMVSFLLGITVGSLITYIFMGKFFSKVIAEIKFKSKNEVDDEADRKNDHPEDKVTVGIRKNMILIIVLFATVVLLSIIAYFVVATGDTVTSNSGEAVADSLGKEHDMGSINNALRKGSGGY